MGRRLPWLERWRKHAEILLEEGRIVQCTIDIADVGFDGEDEYPIIEFILDDGSVINIGLMEEWRFTQ